MKKYLFTIVLFLFIGITFVLSFGCKGEEALLDNRFLSTSGNKIINAKGEEFLIRGVNAGGYLIQEGWMCPTISNLERVIDQKTILETLSSRFSKEEVESLIDTYENNWWKESDFDNIQSIGLNTIRLPFWYVNLEDDSGDIARFERLDWFINQCDARDIYVILDLHGAYGSQNGKDHSGDISGVNLFDSGENREKTLNLWLKVSERYKDRTIVAGYDLLNEPEGNSGTTGTIQWLFYREICEAIRATGDNHIIFLEGVWEANSMPNPDVIFPYSNIVYEFHEYNWPASTLSAEEALASQKSFIDTKILNYQNANFGIPIYIGEFNVFAHKAAWIYTIEEYEKANIGWSFWTYKVKNNGSNWGLYYGTESIEQADISIDSYDEIIRKWSNLKTEDSFILNETLVDIIGGL